MARISFDIFTEGRMWQDDVMAYHLISLSRVDRIDGVFIGTEKTQRVRQDKRWLLAMNR